MPAPAPMPPAPMTPTPMHPAPMHRAPRSPAPISPSRAARHGAARLRLRLPVAAMLCWLASICPGVAGAELYRYVDQDGVTVYSQSPPPTGDADTIRPAPGPGTADTDAARQRLRTGLEQYMDRREQRQREREAARQAEREAEQRAAGCAAARKNLDTMQRLGPHRLRMPDGSLIRPDAQERARMVGELQEQIQAQCD